MVEALRMTFGAGMKFWPLAIWFFFMYGSIMVYQGLWAGPFYHDILGWTMHIRPGAHLHRNRHYLRLPHCRLHLL